MTEYGLLSLADHLADPVTGQQESQADRLQRVVDAAVQAEAAGFDAFAVGEHHFSDYILSAPELILAAAAARTERIRLSTSVTLLANIDPVRQAEKMTTLDVLSGGRAEMTFARGVSQETAIAFGVASFDDLRPRFDEFLRLVLRLFTEDTVTWEGKYRVPLNNVRLQPRSIQQPHPKIWIGGGLSQVSSGLAADLGLSLFLPSLFRWPSDYLEIVEFYRSRYLAANHPSPSEIGFTTYFHVAATSQQARRRWRPHMEHYRDFALGLRGSFGRETDFESLIEGPAICGSPAEVIDRIGHINEMLGLSRHLFLLDAGAVPQHILDDEVEILATEVLPHLN